jgi:hypothetical protein
VGTDQVKIGGPTLGLRPWQTASAVAATLLFVLVTLIPVLPWQATCYDEPVPGPYRSIFVKEVAYWFSMQDVYYWRIDDVLFIRVAPLFDGNKRFDRAGVLQNSEKIARRLENDYWRDGVLYPKPPAVRQVEEEQRRRGVYDGFELCRAAIQVSPLDPLLP